MILNKRVRELITYIDERNSEGLVSDFYGINIQKEFMPTVASTAKAVASVVSPGT